MTLQNRVLPDGRIVALAARGAFMGNRGGRIHDPDTRALTRRRWASKAWICCVTEFRERHRPVMGHSYTELFFLDEVTALAAGHRPCFECRNRDAKAFRRLFAAGDGLADPVPAAAMDDRLHGERLEPPSSVPFSASILAGLPEGTMLRAAEGPCEGAFLAIAAGRLVEWTAGGYTDGPASVDVARVAVLTPKSTTKTLAAGYRPKWHASLAALV